MATHPYDVGDRVLCIGDTGSEENLEVIKIAYWEMFLYVFISTNSDLFVLL